MTLFWILAAALAAVATLALCVPALSGSGAERRSALKVVAGCLVAALLAGALYLRLTNWSWQAISPQVQSAIDDLNSLRRAAEVAPDQPQPWLQLGSAYARLEQYQAAQRAYERANLLAPGRNAAALAGLAEAQLLGGVAKGAVDPAVNARAAQLFEQVLKLEPQNGKALFYTALMAMQSGNPALARERFVAMRRGDLPADIAATLDKQIAALDEQLKPVVADAATAIRVKVDVSDALRAKLPAKAPLFVFVRGASGPPLAARRLTAALPVELTLSAADSMIAGNGLKPGQAVTVVARVSSAGGPLARSGDPYGELQTRAGARGLQSLVIDRLSP